jgi:hypothetical protein
MILLKAVENDPDKAEFIVDTRENGFYIEHCKSGQTFEFDKTKLEFFPDIAYLTFNQKGEFTLFWHFELWHSRDGASSIEVRKLIPPNAVKSPLMIFPIDEDMNVHLYSDRPCYTTGKGESIVIVPEDMASFDAIKENISGILPYLAYCRAKGNALARFNPVDAAAALEYQLDFVYMAVKHLMAQSATKPDFWNAFEREVDFLLSINMVGKEKALSEFVFEKGKTRQNQMNYFAELGGG